MPVVHYARKLGSVPSTWEGWVMRVMTVFVILVLVAAILLYQQVGSLQRFVVNSRAERNAYQLEQTERTCVVLRELGASPTTLVGLQCSAK